MAVVAKIDRAETDGHARPDVVTERHGSQKACSVYAKPFPSRQSGGNDRAARMRLRELVGVVGFIGMRQHAVDKRRFRRARGHFRSNNGRRFVGRKVAGVLKRRASRRQVGPGDHGGERVEDMVLRLLDHLIRESAATGFAHIRAELGHNGANANVVGGKHSSGQRYCRYGPPGAL